MTARDAFDISPLHRHFAAEITGINISAGLEPAQILVLQRAIDEHGVLVFRSQDALDDDGQIAFSAQFGPVQSSITGHRQDLARRLKREELSDISNVDANGHTIPENDLSRLLQRPARLWHTDSSFRDPPGRYTFLAARTLPPSGGNTEFADMRAAYEALDHALRLDIANLRVRHDLARSRALAGAPPLSERERLAMPGAEHDLVRSHSASGRCSLYLASHADQVIGMPEDKGRALLDELTRHATQPQFVYVHVWRPGDLIMWDNRCTMHRATPFDTRHPRDMRRTTVADAN